VVQFPADQDVVTVEEIAPAVVSSLDGTLGRADDVGEQDGDQYPVWLGATADPGQELLHLIQAGSA